MEHGHRQNRSSSTRKKRPGLLCSVIRDITLVSSHWQFTPCLLITTVSPGFLQTGLSPKRPETWSSSLVITHCMLCAKRARATGLVCKLVAMTSFAMLHRFHLPFWTGVGEVENITRQQGWTRLPPAECQLYSAHQLAVSSRACLTIKTNLPTQKQHNNDR